MRKRQKLLIMRAVDYYSESSMATASAINEMVGGVSDYDPTPIANQGAGATAYFGGALRASSRQVISLIFCCARISRNWSLVKKS